jgi:hypothetical protein
MLAASLLILMSLCEASAALCQTEQVRVTKDQATIWRRDAFIAATTVREGTVLEAVGREGAWFIVVIPPGAGGAGELGRIGASQVDVAGAAVSSGQSRSPQRSRSPSASQAGPAASANQPLEVVGFGAASYGSWLAHDTFNAVLGNAGAAMFGGGVQVRRRNLFMEGSVNYFQKSGVRVAVVDRTVYRLGVEDTVRVIPIAATVGYRFPKRRVTPYAGGGIGAYLYKEASSFADPSENLDQSFVSYHAVAGVEFDSRRPVRGAVEVQFTTVPGALGSSGASLAFGEHNLGGIQVRAKILIGKALSRTGRLQK